jgi:hypothetical protein
VLGHDHCGGVAVCQVIEQRADQLAIGGQASCPALLEYVEGGRHGEILSLGLPSWQSKHPMVKGRPGGGYGDASRSAVAGFRVVRPMG